MAVTELTTELLKQIRDGVLETNERLDRTRAELGAKIEQTNERIDRTRTELSAKIDQTRVEFLGKLDETNARIDDTNARLEDTNARLEDTNARLDDTNARLDLTNVRLGRMETSMLELVEHTNTIANRGTDLAGDVADLRRRVERLEQAEPRRQ